MKSGWRGVALVLLVLVWLVPVRAQVATTTLSDTVYRADGTPAQGSVVVSWSAFTMANGASVPAGSTTVTLGANGALTMALAPNAGATPMGSFYTAVLHLSDGTVSREYWVIPVTVPGGGPAKLAGVRNQVMPASVAMQSVSKAYVDNAITRAQFGVQPLDSSPYVEKAGDTMTGPLVLPGDPVTPTQAADKNYVDTQVTAVTGGLNGKVALLPTTTQTIAQPSGTQLNVNRLNGVEYATGYQTLPTNDGVSEALTSADCAGVACTVVAEPTYGGPAGVNLDQATGRAHVEDERGAAEVHLHLDPAPITNPDLTGETRRVTLTEDAASVSARANTSLLGMVVERSMDALSGGSNLTPSVGTVPYFKATYGLETGTANYYTSGQHVNTSSYGTCTSVGDCIDHASRLLSSGGSRDGSDEGSHQYDYLTFEDLALFRGTCATGCTTGSTQLLVSATADGGNQGDGRYLMDTAPGKTISGGQLVGGTLDRHGVALFAGTNFPVSTMLVTAADAVAQAHNMAPGTVTLPIATTGVPAGFVTNTAALPAASGVACVADVALPPFQIDNFETAAYTVVDGTHVQVTLNKTHAAGATLAVGGLCGYGLELKVDTYGYLKQVFPIIGSVSATELFYKPGAVASVGNSLSLTGSAYANVSLPIATVTRSANVAHVHVTGRAYWDLNGLAVTLAGVNDASFNGTFTVSSDGPYDFEFASVGADTTTSGGTLSLVTGDYALYPMAEALSVMNAGTRTIDGSFTLAANTVDWAAGDPVEEPHYFQQDVHASSEIVRRFLPQRNGANYQGLAYEGVIGPGTSGYAVLNNAPVNEYYGEGGTHHLPFAGFLERGPWTDSLEVDAGEEAVLRVHCNLHGCNKWNSSYALMLIDGEAGAQDALNYSPTEHAATWLLGGTQYSFSPSAFTAGTINAGTLNVNALNATTITGGVDGGAISSGTIPAARLPVFGPSGTTHSVGAVPDPGATAGATRFLREDGTWSVPSGGGGGGSTGAGTFTDSGVALTATTTGAGAFQNVANLLAPNLAAGQRTCFSFGKEATTANNSAAYCFLYAGNGSTSNAFEIYAGFAGLISSVDFLGNAKDGGTHTATGYVETLHTPASSTEACTAGAFTDDANFHYVCVAANTWKRVALSAF